MAEPDNKVGESGADPTESPVDSAQGEQVDAATQMTGPLEDPDNPASTESPASVSPITQGYSLWRSKAAWFWALFVAVITVVTSIVSIFPIIFNDETNIKSLKIDVTPFRPESVSHFALPEDAPLEDFPTGGNLCSAEQEEWLKVHGVKYQRDYLVELRNGADNGGSLAVSNFHGQADSTEPAAIAYLVECDKLGEPGIAEEPARLIVDNGGIAFFDKSFIAGEGVGQPNSPVGYNLRPGEIVQFVLSLASLSDFDGVVVASLASGSDSKDVPIIPTRDDVIQVPGVISPRTILISIEDGELTCNVFANSSAQIKTCVAGELFRASVDLP